MTDPAVLWLSQIMKATYGAQPGRIRTVADEVALTDIAELLAEAEQAKAILRARGWGAAGTSLVDVARSVPRAKSVVTS